MCGKGGVGVRKILWPRGRISVEWDEVSEIKVGWIRVLSLLCYVILCYVVKYD